MPKIKTGNTQKEGLHSSSTHYPPRLFSLYHKSRSLHNGGSFVLFICGENVGVVDNSTLFVANWVFMVI